MKARQASRQGFEHELSLDARERRAEAEVAGPAEREVAIVRSARSRRSGSGKRSGSRLAAPMTAMTAWRFWICLAAELGVLEGQARGVLARALVAKELLDRGRRRATGPTSRAPTGRDCAAGSSIPLPIRLVVVSWPPTIVMIVLAMTSSSLNRSPSTSAVMSACSKPSRGALALLVDRRVGSRPSCPRPS